MNQGNTLQPQIDEDSIDIIALLKSFWNSRVLIIKVVSLFTIIGFLVAILSKNEYTASSTIVPIVGGKSVDGKLGGLASLAGINLGGSSGGANGEISPELYPEILSSVPFQLELLETKLKIEEVDTLVTYKEYYEEFFNPGVLSTFKKYTIGLPGVVISLFKNEEDVKNKITRKNDIIKISNTEYGLIEGLSSKISLNVNAKEGFISISATMPEPEASAQLTLRAQLLLQEYAMRFKTQKSIEQLKYIEERYLEKQKEFDTIKLKLALFQDQNNAINTAVAKSKLLQLQSEYDLTFTVYSELANQLETQRLQVKKDTPIFTILKPVTIPSEKSGPKRALILIVFTFLGLVFSLGYILLKDFLKDFKKDWEAKV